MVTARRWLVRLPGVVRRHARTRRSRTSSSDRPHLMLGCAERSLFPSVSRAARQLRPELDAPSAQGCCAALHAHNGERERGHALAAALGRDLPGTIVTTSGGCAAHLADVIGRDRVMEISEYLTRTGEGAWGEIRVNGRRARVTLQDSCHLRNGLGVWREPRALLAQVADYVEMPNAGGCCGAAGTYSLVRPKDSRAVLEPKLAAIRELEVDYVVTVNPGCQRQLQQGVRRNGMRPRVVHLVELLQMAAESTSRVR